MTRFPADIIEAALRTPRQGAGQPVHNGPMGEDYSKSGMVNRVARAAVQMQMYMEETARSLGVTGVSCTWDVEGGWEQLPAKATLVARGRGEPVRVEFSREEIAAFPTEAGTGASSGRLREAAQALASRR